MSINSIDSSWITDVYNNFLWPYMEKNEYCLILDMDRFKAYILQW